MKIRQTVRLEKQLATMIRRRDKSVAVMDKRIAKVTSRRDKEVAAMDKRINKVARRIKRSIVDLAKLTDKLGWKYNVSYRDAGVPGYVLSRGKQGKLGLEKTVELYYAVLAAASKKGFL